MKRLFFVFAALCLLSACKSEDKPDMVEEGQGIRVTGITLAPSSATVKEGETVTLTYTIDPQNATNTNIVWSSSDSSIATVEEGIVNGIKAGNAVITVTTEDGGKTATCAVKVEKNLAPSVTIGAEHVSAISAVLRGKVNLGSTVAGDLRIGFQYSKSAGILPSNSFTVEASDADSDYNYIADVTGLEPDTKYYSRSFVRQNDLYTFGETKEFNTKDISSLIRTTEASSISVLGARVNASLDLTDVQYTTQSLYFLYGTDAESLYQSESNIEKTAGGYSAVLVPLDPSREYYFQACVSLDDKEYKGSILHFTTKGIETIIETLEVSEKSETAGVLNAKLDISGIQYEYLRYGFSWGTSENDLTNYVEGQNFENNSFSATLSNLSYNTQYWYRAHLLIEFRSDRYYYQGYDYREYSGEIKSFTTNAPKLEAVDLGLSVNWANMNLGASVPEDCGDYYAWGETETKQNYSWSTYRWGDGDFFTKYCLFSSYGTPDYKVFLDFEDDGAHVKLGENWRIPSTDDFQELKKNCTWTWETYRGVKGYRVTSNIPGYTDKWIFLPISGLLEGDDLIDEDKYGYYWSSVIYPQQTNYSYLFLMTESSSGFSLCDRYNGIPIRPVFLGPNYVTVSSISINSESLSIRPGESKLLSATILPENSSEKRVIWMSSNPDVAVVYEDGSVVGVSGGTTTIIAICGRERASCSVSVTNSGGMAIPDAVDLGLSVKWASFNLGAFAPENPGLYYSWGETESKMEYSWNNYIWCNGSANTFTKYNIDSSRGAIDNKTKLDIGDDAAHIKLGGSWRMPTISECSELCANCECAWVTQNGSNGIKFTSKKNGNSIFLPASGYSWYEFNVIGWYWSTDLCTWTSSHGSTNMARALYLSDGGVSIGTATRSMGCAIRPVTD